MNFRPVHRRRHEADFNLAPLVDVVLQLVLFFMVTAQFAVLPGLKLKLPEVGPGRLAKTDERLEIAVTARGEVFFEGRPCLPDRLAGLLRRNGGLAADVVILLSADRDTPHGLVVGIMEILAREGFTRVVIAARTAGADAPEGRP